MSKERVLSVLLQIAAVVTTEPGNIEQPTSNNQHRTTNIEQPTSNNQHRTTNIEQPTSNNQHRTTNIEQPTSNGQHRMAIPGQATISRCTRHVSSLVISHSSLVIRH